MRRMITTLCTIGFAGKTAEEFFSLLTQAGVKRLIDIRVNRHGQLSGFAKYPDLVFFLHEIAGIAYAWEPRLLGMTLTAHPCYRFCTNITCVIDESPRLR